MSIESFTTITPVAKTKSQPKPQVEPRLADYGLPPDVWKQSNHYFHYGWPVTNKIIHSAFRKLPFKVPNRKLSAGLLCSRLELNLNFRGIRALLCKPDEFCESQGRAFTDDDDQRYVQFISIGCTCSRRYFWRRPDPKTMEDLIKIMGEEPRWMENASIKQEFATGLLA